MSINSTRNIGITILTVCEASKSNQKSVNVVIQSVLDMALSSITTAEEGCFLNDELSSTIESLKSLVRRSERGSGINSVIDRVIIATAEINRKWLHRSIGTFAVRDFIFEQLPLSEARSLVQYLRRRHNVEEREYHYRSLALRFQMAKFTVGKIPAFVLGKIYPFMEHLDFSGLHYIGRYSRLLQRVTNQKLSLDCDHLFCPAVMSKIDQCTHLDFRLFRGDRASFNKNLRELPPDCLISIDVTTIMFVSLSFEELLLLGPRIKNLKLGDCTYTQEQVALLIESCPHLHTFQICSALVKSVHIPNAKEVDVSKCPIMEEINVPDARKVTAIGCTLLKKITAPKAVEIHAIC